MFGVAAQTPSASGQIPAGVKILSEAEIGERLHRNATRNEDRERTLKSMFEEVGCAGERLAEQQVKHEKLPNVICTAPGAADSEIIVGAHFDHVDAGKGVVDNWSGASLLPSFYEGLASAPRKHKILFIGFTDEENGLHGSEFYVKQLDPAAAGNIRAMVNLDSLGLGPTKIWLTHSDAKLAKMFIALANSIHSPLGVMNADHIGDEDGSSFRGRRIPTVMIHSITAETFPILHSPDDNFRALHMKEYYETYRLTLAYLAFLDSTLD